LICKVCSAGIAEVVVVAEVAIVVMATRRAGSGGGSSSQRDRRVVQVVMPVGKRREGRGVGSNDAQSKGWWPW